MKIEGPGRTSGPRGVSKADSKKKSGDSAFGGMIDDTEETASAPSTGAPVSVAGLDALLSLQEAEDGTSEGAAAKGRRRATALLDELDKVRLGILTGGIPKTSLQHISHMVAAHREKSMDPALNEILDEIDLRAQVELAKHGG